MSVAWLGLAHDLIFSFFDLSGLGAVVPGQLNQTLFCVLAERVIGLNALDCRQSNALNQPLSVGDVVTGKV